MSTTKVEKLIAFYNDTSIAEPERAVVAKKLIPLLIEQVNWTKPISDSHGEDYNVLKMKCARLKDNLGELLSENFSIKIENKRLKNRIEKEIKNNKRDRSYSFYFGLGIGILITWLSYKH